MVKMYCGGINGRFLRIGPRRGDRNRVTGEKQPAPTTPRRFRNPTRRPLTTLVLNLKSHRMSGSVELWPWRGRRTSLREPAEEPRRGSSVGQSGGLIIRRSGVRVPTPVLPSFSRLSAAGSDESPFFTGERLHARLSMRTRSNVRMRQIPTQSVPSGAANSGQGVCLWVERPFPSWPEWKVASGRNRGAARGPTWRRRSRPRRGASCTSRSIRACYAS